MPQFNGEFSKWIYFSDCFDATIIKNGDLTNIQTFQYLTSSLKGSALEVIKSLPISNENFGEAWEHLCNRYNNKKSLVFNYYKEMHDISPIRKGSSSTLCQLHDTFVNSIRALKSLDRQTDNLGDALSYLILTKLDPNILKEWDSKADGLEPPKLKALLEFLEKQMRLLENHERQKASILQSKAIKVNENRNSSLYFTTSESNCLHCKGNHSLTDCASFRK